MCQFDLFPVLVLVRGLYVRITALNHCNGAMKVSALYVPWGILKFSSEMPGKDNGDMNSFRNAAESLQC